MQGEVTSWSAGFVMLITAVGLLDVCANRADAQVPWTRASDPVLVGAIDIHAHQDPDSFGPHSNQQARSVDGIDIARMAQEIGMRGFVIKQHYDTTAHLAYIVRQIVPGVEVFGALGLNRSMGGLNVSAVQHFAEIKGGYARLVFMPTWDAEHYVRNSRNPDRPFVSVSRNGELLPDAKDVIAEIARSRTRDSNGPLVLATGHNSPDEVMMMVREGHRVGLRHIVVTHPLLPMIGMSIEQMQEVAKLGAFIEFVSSFARGAQAEERTREYVEAIRAVGVEHCIISSDVGQAKSPMHPDALVAAANALRANGFTERELDLMFKENPARLLGLPPRAQPSAATRP